MKSLSLGSLFFGSLVLLSGCGGGGGGAGSAPLTATASSSIAVSVMGGGSPIQGSSVVLCSVAQSIGQANPPDLICGSLLGSGTTDSAGSVSISFNPPSSGLVYAIASGGSAGSGSNSYIKLASAVGSGGTIPASVTLNELTTAAMLASVRPFLGMNMSGKTLLTENVQHGVSRFVSQPDGQLISSTSTQIGVGDSVLSYIGNVLATCVDASNPGTTCQDIFSTIKTASGSGYVPSNTIQAALMILEKPSANYSSLIWGGSGPFGAQSLPSTFSPTVLAYGSSYYSTYMSPFYPAIDASGNLWVTSCDGLTNYAVTEMIARNNYAPVTIASNQTVGTSLLDMPTMPAIDANGNVWISNDFAGQGFLTEIQPGSNNAVSAHLLPSSFNQGGFDVSVDNSGNVFVQGYSNGGAGYPEIGRVTATNPSSTSTYQGGPSNSGADAMTVDGNGNVWVADCVNNTIVKLAPTGGTNYAYNAYSITGVLNPAGLAVDPSNNIWIANSDCGAGSANIMELPGGDPSTPVTFSTVAITGSSTSWPISLVSDSAGNIWSVDYNMNELIELGNNSGSYTGIVAGVLPSGQSYPHGLAIDGNGNIWVTDNGDRTTYTGGGVVEFIGMAAPVKTPVIGPPVVP